jgi:hypothetical protein
VKKQVQWRGLVPAALWSSSVSLLLAAPAAAQIPPQLQGIPVFPPVPYMTSTSLGPFGPIENPAADADVIRYAEELWKFIDSGGTYTDPLDNFVWLAPELLALGDPANGVLAQPDPFGGGFDLFEVIYSHRLAPFDPNGPATIQGLLEVDSFVALTWKHWTLTHQLATEPTIDLVAHQRHVDLLVNAIFGLTPYASVRGVPSFSGFLVSDRLSIENWSAIPWAFATMATSEPDPRAEAQAQECIDMKKDDLSGFPDLYKPDQGYSWGGLSGGDPGFDCDDFADATGANITKGKSGVSYCNIYCSFNGTKPGGKKGPSAGHLVTQIKAGDKYWLVDGQTGLTTGPHQDGTPPDASPITEGGYGAKPGTTKTDPDGHAPNDRSAWQGIWSGEPGPWHTDPEEVARFGEITGLDPECFIQATKAVEAQ